MRGWLGLGVLLLCLAPLGCDDDTTITTLMDLSATPPDMASRVVDMAFTGDAAFTASVMVKDDFYAPASVLIAAGGTVTWTFVGANPHTVTSNTGLFDSSPEQTTGTFTHTFATPGTFPYHCLVHGTSMSGTVIVR
jgi:plastocyanin